jgi:hypothetical protein
VRVKRARAIERYFLIARFNAVIGAAVGISKLRERLF